MGVRWPDGKYQVLFTVYRKISYDLSSIFQKVYLLGIKKSGNVSGDSFWEVGPRGGIFSCGFLPCVTVTSAGGP